MDLSAGSAEDLEDQEVLLDWYFEQAAHARIAMLPENLEDRLDQCGELVLSPLFLVRVPGKNPRPIINLSARGEGVNQRVSDTLDTNPEGYATIQTICRLVVHTFIRAVLKPDEFELDDIRLFRLVMLVIDGDSAFTRQGVHEEAIGIQAARVNHITAIAMCLLFGWARSAEAFSHISAGVRAVAKSNTNNMTLLKPQFSSEHSSKSPALSKLLNDNNPPNSGANAMHVDDLSAVEVDTAKRPTAAAADLVWAVKAFLGNDGVSLKKFVASTFWTDFQKVVGAWFDVENLAVIMPHGKIAEALEILTSEEFSESANTFTINSCATLRGKTRWAAFCTTCRYFWADSMFASELLLIHYQV